MLKKFCQVLHLPSIYFDKDLKFRQSSKISPNLVTLLLGKPMIACVVSKIKKNLFHCKKIQSNVELLVDVKNLCEIGRCIKLGGI